MEPLDGKVAMVTGASHGIGATVARPRTHRILEVAPRPVAETSRGRAG